MFLTAILTDNTIGTIAAYDVPNNDISALIGTEVAVHIFDENWNDVEVFGICEHVF